MPADSLFLSLLKEQKGVSGWIGREITFPQDRSITERSYVRCLNRLESLTEIVVELHPGESTWDAQDGEVYHGKSGTCAVTGIGLGRREGKRKGLDERTMPGTGQHTSLLGRDKGLRNTKRQRGARSYCKEISLENT